MFFMTASFTAGVTTDMSRSPASLTSASLAQSSSGARTMCLNASYAWP